MPLSDAQAGVVAAAIISDLDVLCGAAPDDADRTELMKVLVKRIYAAVVDNAVILGVTGYGTPGGPLPVAGTCALDTEPPPPDPPE